MISLNGVPLLGKNGLLRHAFHARPAKPKPRRSHYEVRPHLVDELPDQPPEPGSPWGMAIIEEVLDEET